MGRSRHARGFRRPVTASTGAKRNSSASSGGRRPDPARQIRRRRRKHTDRRDDIPGNVDTDRIDKKNLYAEAGIPWELLVEPDFEIGESVTLSLLRLNRGEHTAHATSTAGEALMSALPFPISVSTATLPDR